MKDKKWNYKTGEYYDYELPEHACLYTDDMIKVIACAECGRKMVFGDGYTSKQIHTDFGLGYTVCRECYKREWKEGRENAKANKTNRNI